MKGHCVLVLVVFVALWRFEEGAGEAGARRRSSSRRRRTRKPRRIVRRSGTTPRSRSSPMARRVCPTALKADSAPRLELAGEGPDAVLCAVDTDTVAPARPGRVLEDRSQERRREDQLARTRPHGRDAAAGPRRRRAARRKVRARLLPARRRQARRQRRAHVVEPRRKTGRGARRRRRSPVRCRRRRATRRASPRRSTRARRRRRWPCTSRATCCSSKVATTRTDSIWGFKADGTPVGLIDVLGGKGAQPISIAKGSFSIIDPSRVALADHGMETLDHVRGRDREAHEGRAQGRQARVQDERDRHVLEGRRQGHRQVPCGARQELVGARRRDRGDGQVEPARGAAWRAARRARGARSEVAHREQEVVSSGVVRRRRETRPDRRKVPTTRSGERRAARSRSPAIPRTAAIARRSRAIPRTAETSTAVRHAICAGRCARCVTHIFCLSSDTVERCVYRRTE